MSKRTQLAALALAAVAPGLISAADDRQPPAAAQEIPGPFTVFFNADSDEITPAAAAILDKVAEAHRRSPGMQVVISGHTDRSMAADYAVGLSQRMAANVRAYLAGRGIPNGVMTTQAFGESRPLIDTADGVREPQNRRVELTFGPGSGW
jgi:OOP family OmpA-OmpF porin